MPDRLAHPHALANPVTLARAKVREMHTVAHAHIATTPNTLRDHPVAQAHRVANLHTGTTTQSTHSDSFAHAAPVTNSGSDAHTAAKPHSLRVPEVPRERGRQQQQR